MAVGVGVDVGRAGETVGGIAVATVRAGVCETDVDVGCTSVGVGEIVVAVGGMLRLSLSTVGVAHALIAIK